MMKKIINKSNCLGEDPTDINALRRACKNSSPSPAKLILHLLNILEKMEDRIKELEAKND